MHYSPALWKAVAIAINATTRRTRNCIVDILFILKPFKCRRKRYFPDFNGMTLQNDDDDDDDCR